MKKLFFSMIVALMATVAVKAQQIAVVAEDGATTLFKTLDEAITNAKPGSVIYLPGGGFPVSDETVITKKLTIIGIGHKVKGENADGHTTITGNLSFNQGSDGSALMGVYVSGGVYIGKDGKRVDDIMIRYCNLYFLEVKSSSCLGTIVNQNYIRRYSYFNGARGEFTNNVALAVRDLNNGFITNNIFLSTGGGNTGDIAGICDCLNCSITNNVFYDRYGCTNSLFDNNMIAKASINEDEVGVRCGAWGDIFENYPAGYSAVYPSCKYLFKGDYKQYNGQIGIYGGTGFNYDALPPVPYIVSKEIAEKTDAEGKLKIDIRVKASE